MFYWLVWANGMLTTLLQVFLIFQAIINPQVRKYLILVAQCVYNKENAQIIVNTAIGDFFAMRAAAAISTPRPRTTYVPPSDTQRATPPPKPSSRVVHSYILNQSERTTTYPTVPVVTDTPASTYIAKEELLLVGYVTSPTTLYVYKHDDMVTKEAKNRVDEGSDEYIKLCTQDPTLPFFRQDE